MDRHVIQKKYEFLRIIDRLEDENILVVIANIREVSEDWKTGKIEVLSRHSHSEEYHLHNIPIHIQRLTAIEPTQISPMEFLKLTKLYKK
ncbi:hypothetical protein ACIQYL_20555 [Lysinibacillus xylanilyticus]|uniref:hypothetical protein n=1 Tax=Lysinibacillus xylanilyticus TaxID=582475 RepID=UPI003807F02A